MEDHVHEALSEEEHAYLHEKGADFVKLLPEQIHFQSLAFLFSQKSL